MESPKLINSSNLGFNQYRNLGKLNFLPVDGIRKEDAVSTKSDELLDMIYCIDERTGLPSGSLEQYLSDKTDDVVRSFIEKNILVEHQDGKSIIPQNLRDEVLSLDSDFIAMTSRKRYESLDDYENRVMSYIDKIEESKRINANLRKFAKKNNDE